MNKMVLEHPQKHKRFQEAARRFLELQESHRRATEMMWVGTLVANFSQQELEAMDCYLSVADKRNLQRMRDMHGEVKQVIYDGIKAA